MIRGIAQAVPFTCREGGRELTDSFIHSAGSPHSVGILLGGPGPRPRLGPHGPFVRVGICNTQTLALKICAVGGTGHLVGEEKEWRYIKVPLKHKTFSTSPYSSLPGIQTSMSYLR